MTEFFDHEMALYTYQNLFTNKWSQSPSLFQHVAMGFMEQTNLPHFVVSQPACAPFQSDRRGAALKNDGFHSGITEDSNLLSRNYMSTGKELPTDEYPLKSS